MQWKKILVLSLFVFVAGGLFAFAQEPGEEPTLPRTGIMEILQNYPEAMAEIQELLEERQSSIAGDDEPGFFGMMRARMMRGGQMQGGRMQKRQHMRSCLQLEGYAPMMGPRWNKQ